MISKVRSRTLQRLVTKGLLVRSHQNRLIRVRRDRVEQRFPERARIDRRVLKRLKRGVERREAESAPEPEEFFTPPRYDEIYERARRMMEDEEDAY